MSDREGAENRGVVEVIDLKPPHRYENGDLDPSVIRPNGTIRVLQTWCFERGKSWVVGENPISLHVSKFVHF